MTITVYQRVSSNDESRERKKKSILYASFISFALLLAVAMLFLIATIEKAAAKPKTLPPPPLPNLSNNIASSSSSTGAVAAACKPTLYPDACASALASAADKSPQQQFRTSVQFAMGQVRSARAMAYNLTLISHPSSPVPSGMQDCVELLDISLDQLADVLKRSSSTHDVQTWLSSALTNQVTCSESLNGVGGRDGQGSAAGIVGYFTMHARVQNLEQLISNSLALHQSLKPRRLPPLVAGRGRRRQLWNDHDFPAWVSAGDRKLLAQASPEKIRANAVVAQDGSGTHRSISEAIAFVSLAGSGSGGRSVIYVKSGTYKENLDIPRKQKNVMLMGDGKGKTVIVGGRNADDGWTTYQSATVAAMGSGFIAKGLTIINNAGPSKHQAVALRVGADLSVVTQCSIQGYQDTLYTHSNRQFYRDNDIYGTVDFIFGNSAVVIQNCLIQPRRPSSGQKNSVTAQGRTDPNQNTGISIHNCKIQGAADIGSTPTYLGRPWHQYSRTVVLGSYLDASINPAGWEQWSGNFALSTLYYGEYGNTGPGASVSGRVGWRGVHASLSKAEASQFTVGQFILGDSWLPATGVPYDAGL